MIETYFLIEAERRRQARKWGEQNYPDERWNLILGEEVGEVCNAILDKGEAEVLAELIQVAAVATQWIEAIGRRCQPS